MRELYKKIKENKEAKSCELIIGLGSKSMGDKLFYANGEVLFQTKEADEILCDECFREKLNVNARIIVCGAGTVGQEVIRLGRQLGYRVASIEDRADYANFAREAGADEVINEAFSNGLETLNEEAQDYYIVMTREHKYDRACLEKIMKRKHVYVGMMASKNRAGMLKEALVEDGFHQEAVDEIHSPIGLNIKAQTPAEIAVSIFAEIISHKNETQVMEGFSDELLDAILSAKEEEKLILATIVKRTGSAPREVGTKMLIRQDGSFVGSIGGGWIEAGVQKLAKEMFLEEKAHVLFETDKDSEDAVLCGGYESIFLEMI